MTRDQDIIKQLQFHLSETLFRSRLRCFRGTINKFISKDSGSERCVYNEWGQLVELHLCGMYRTQVPPEVWQCSSLQKLCLHSNQLSSLPAEMGQLTSLQSLDLDYNRFSSLPQLTALQRLNLRDNQLSTLPAGMSQLTSLQELNLSGNQLSNLPAELGQLTSLQRLDLSYNELSNLPAELGQLTSLQELNLRDNQLSSLPAELGQLTSLQRLELDKNQLSSLPAELGQLAALQTFWLGDNQLSALPAELGQLTSLQSLYLVGNPLQSPPPEIVGQGTPTILAYLRALPPPPPIKIFYCYAHEDRALRDLIDKHLSSLKRQGQVVAWYDREIQAGIEWEREIERRLSTAHIVLLLVSADFMSSDYCYGKEMRRALEMHKQGKVRVLPILLRPVDWQDAPFAKLQILPTGAKPITRWPDPEEALEDVAKQIRAVVNTLRTRRS